MLPAHSLSLSPAVSLVDRRPSARPYAASTNVCGSLVGFEARRWFALAIGSLVVAGLLSLSVVIGRLPVISAWIGDPLFFKRCLVVHVNLALVVWFYTFLAGLVSLQTSRGETAATRVAFVVAVAGVGAMLLGALVPGAEPVLANYVPVIAHPLFAAGLMAFFGGALVFFVHALLRGTAAAGSILPAESRIGLQAAAILLVVAAATWVSARAGLPAGVDAFTRAEFLAWGPGHVLQAANAAAMLAVWLWLAARATGGAVLSPRAAQGVFALLVLPHAAMPLLTLRGTLDGLYHTGATQLMRWTIFPSVLVVLGLTARHLWRHRFGGSGTRERFANPGESLTASATPNSSRVALTGFLASATLAVLGMVLGACIRSSTTLVPAHYHASLGAVTMAFMTAAFLVCDAVRREQACGFAPSRWRRAWWQLLVYGVGQTVFVAGFALGGVYGLGRKAYAAEQHVRSTGELVGLGVMGAGGLLAVIGGLWFLFLVLREFRGWWPRAARRERFSP